MDEDTNPEDVINNNIVYNLSEKNFIVEMLGMFSKLKETMEQTANKTKYKQKWEK